MNIYVRRNMAEQWWEMCIETNRNNWFPIMDYQTMDFMETMDQEIVKIDARHLWGGIVDDCLILMAPPVRERENTHGYYN